MFMRKSVISGFNLESLLVAANVYKYDIWTHQCKYNLNFFCCKFSEKWESDKSVRYAQLNTVRWLPDLFFIFLTSSHNHFPSLGTTAMWVWSLCVWGKVQEGVIVHCWIGCPLITRCVYVCGRWKSRLLIILILLFVSLWSSWLCIRQGNH